jgi:threonine-phosphate decarboxylase
MDIYDYAEEKRLSLRQVMDFTTSVNPLGPSTKARNILRKNIKNIEFFPDNRLRYITRLIEKREGVQAQNILFGHGSTHLLHTILQTTKTKTVIVLSPVSQMYEKIISLNNAAFIRLPPEKKNGFSIGTEDIFKAMKEVDTILLPYPHDVTGAAPAMDDLLALISEAERLGKTLILDESYRDYTAMGSPVQAIVSSQKSIIIRTFSLFYALAGIPFAYGMGPSDIVQNMQQHISSEELDTLAVHAAIASLKDSFYKSRTTDFIQEEKTYFLKALASVDGLSYFDTPCPFILLSFDKSQKSLKNIFSRYHILIDEFFDGEGALCLKVPIKKHKWNARFIKTLKNALGANQ